MADDLSQSASTESNRQSPPAKFVFADYLLILSFPLVLLFARFMFKGNSPWAIWFRLISCSAGLVFFIVLTRHFQAHRSGKYLSGLNLFYGVSAILILAVGLFEAVLDLFKINF